MAKKTNADRQENAFQAMIWPVLVLVIICIACSAALAALHKVTAPVIEENTRIRTLESYVVVLPEGTSADSLTELTVSEASLSAGVTGAVSAPDGSIAVQAAAAGYSGKAVTVYVAFDASGSIANLLVDASTQTAGIGSAVGEESFTSGFAGFSASGHVSDGTPVDAVAGATYSSNAVYNAVNAAIDCYNNDLKGAA